MQWAKKQTGFTIVELLIVVIVIAILATITLVGFNGIQNRARSSTAQQAAQQAAKKVATYALENNEQYPAAAGTDGADALSALGITTNGQTRYQYSSNNTTTPRTYCITTTVGVQSFYISSANQAVRQGGCPGHGQNGVAAVTNLFRNPGVAGSSLGFGSWHGTSPNNSTTSIVSAPWASSGSAHQVQWTAVPNQNSGDIHIRLDMHGLVPDSTYTLIYKLRGPNRAFSINAPTLFATSGRFDTIARSHSGNTSLSSGSVVGMWHTFNADAAAYGAALRVTNGTPGKVVNDTFSVADVMVYEGEYNPSINWAWGNSQDWEWLGAPNNSASRGPAL